jgi:cytochrome c peroxidase
VLPSTSTSNANKDSKAGAEEERFALSKPIRSLIICSAVLIVLLCVSWAGSQQPLNQQTLPEAYRFNQEEIAYLERFTLDHLPPAPASTSNAVADSEQAAQLGHQIFFDARTSELGHISCATCHQPQRYFTDGLPVAVGVAPVTRNTPTIVGAAYSHWQFWDGRKDSLWSQALGPLENPKEHGGSRMRIAHLIESSYKTGYEALFGAMPDLADETRFPVEANPMGNAEAIALWEAMTPVDQAMVNRIFVNVGKALEAYQRKLKPAPGDYDRFVQALKQRKYAEAMKIYSQDQVLGMRLFMGRANCASCHNGPLFTNSEFHNVGIPERDQTAVDLGRYLGVKQLAEDPFNCLSEFSDASPEECLEIRFLKTEGKELVAAFKAPSLRNVALTAPYMHSGQFADLLEVIEHYNKPKPPFFDPQQQPNRPHFDIMPLRLTELQKQQLKQFLESLTGGVDSQTRWLQPPNSLTAKHP